MGGSRDLNGLPNELTQKYLSSLLYFKHGYMGDWLWTRMNELGLEEAQLDILDESTAPSHLRIKPVVVYFPDIKETIQKKLNSHDFESDHIVHASFHIAITNLGGEHGDVNLRCEIQTKEDQKYTGDLYTYPATPIASEHVQRFVSG